VGHPTHYDSGQGLGLVEGRSAPSRLAGRLTLLCGGGERVHLKGD